MKTALKLIKLLIAAALFWVLFSYTDISKLLEQFGSLSASWIALLLGVSVVLIYVSALKWGMFIEHLGERVSVFKLFSLYLLGYFVNLILPSYLGGDAVRSWHIGKKVGQHNAAAATILERYTGLSAMLCLGLICMWFTDLVSWKIRLVLILLALGMIFFSIAAMSAFAQSIIAKLPFGIKLVKHLVKLKEGFSLAFESPSLLIKAYALSFLYHSLTVLNTVTCAYAIGWIDVPGWSLFTVLPLILILGAIPISPQGLGIQDGAFFYFFQGIGATPEQALGVALLLRAKSYVLALAGGVVWMVLRKDRVLSDVSQPPEESFPQGS